MKYSVQLCTPCMNLAIIIILVYSSFYANIHSHCILYKCSKGRELLIHPNTISNYLLM